jgi:hypothetical protein
MLTSLSGGGGRKTMRRSPCRVKSQWNLQRGTWSETPPAPRTGRLRASPKLHARTARAPAGRMPRNEGQKIEEQAPFRDRAIVRDAAAELTDLPWIRLTQRQEPPRDRRSLWLLVALVIAAHVLLGWVAYLILRPAPYSRDESGVIAVSLIESGSELPPPPPLVPPPPLQGGPAASAPARRLHYVPPAKGAISATLEGVKGPPLQLYESDGQVRLPPGSGKPAPPPAYQTPGIKGSQISSGKSPLPYKPTRFNEDWAPDKESLGQKTIGRAVEKVIEKTTMQKTVHLPGGIRLHCALSPLALFAGCKGDDPPPPPKNDDDIRLSMPPPETLTGKKVPLPKPASSAAKPASANSAPAAASS